MTDNYWSRFASNRLTRRRALGLTGATIFSAAFLAACGGDDDDSAATGSSSATGASTGASGATGASGSTGATGTTGGTGATGSTGATGATGSTGTSSLLTQGEDTRAQAKVGGVFRTVYNRDTSSFDPAIQGPSGNVLDLTLNTLVTIEHGILDYPTSNVLPELAESWEFSADRTQLTLKLRKDVVWHNKAPVNGRAFTSDDVVFSLERAQELATNRGNYFTSINPEGLFTGWSAPDDFTIVLNLNKPVYYAISNLANFLGGNIAILPREADGGYDVRQDAIGTGPYVLTEYTPSVKHVFTRNANYFDKGAGFMESIEQPIVVEYAAQLAQFKAGNVYAWNYTSGVSPQDVLATKSEVPDLDMYTLPITVGPRLPIHAIGFGWLPENESPFLDERVRQAVSLAMDRDLWIEAFYNTDRFTSAGLPVEVRWSTAVWADRDGWLDPQSSEFGENAKYFQYNIEEAKKLLAAAGYPNGLTVKSTITTDGYGAAHGTATDAIEGMLADAGFKAERNDVPNATDFIPNYREVSGRYEGWAMKVGGGDNLDTIARIRSEYFSGAGQGFLGFPADSTVDSLVQKALVEFDRDARIEIGNDLQRYLAGKMYDVKWPGGASGFGLAWPIVKNFAVFNPLPYYSKNPAFYYWLDQTQKPL